MIWWFHLVVKSSWNILSSIVHKSSQQIGKCVKRSLKGGYQRHPVSSVGRAPVCRAGGRGFKPRPDQWLKNWRDHAGYDLRPSLSLLTWSGHWAVTLSRWSCLHHPSFISHNRRGPKRTHTTVQKSRASSPGGVVYLSLIIHITDNGWVTRSS